MKAPFEAAGLSDIGRVRTNNEDSFFYDAEKGIFIVADGMGGHNSGEVASAFAVSMVKDFLIQKSPGIGCRIRKGLLREEEAAVSELQNLLTRAVGSNPEVEVDVSTHPLFFGDVLLLASDGLTKMVADFRIQEILSRKEDAATLASRLISAALEAGGLDNVTVVVARVQGERKKSPWTSPWSKMKSILRGPHAEASS